MPSSPVAEAWITELDSFRRRIRLASFARGGPMVCALALAGLNAALLALGPGAGVAIAAYIAVTIIALGGTYGVVLLRGPSLEMTARIVDDRFRLDNRAVTALQFAVETDDMSRLVVADAARRLETIPVSRIPVAVPPSSGWAISIMLVVSALVVVRLAGAESTPASMGGGSQASSEVDSRSPRASEAARAGTPARRGRTGVAGRPEDSPGGSHTEAVAGRSSSAAVRSGSDASRGDEGRRPSPGETPVPSSARPDAESASGAPISAGNAPGIGSERSGDRARDAGSGSLSARGRGASAVVAEGVAGGGVTGGSLSGPQSGRAGAPQSIPTRLDASRYRQALARAETAIARDRVPSRLRAYVRDYFVAIRPAPEP